MDTDMFENYPLKSISIIIDIAGHAPAIDGSPILDHVKKALIHGLESLEDDDLVYVYRHDGVLEMGRTVAESVGIVSDWEHVSGEITSAFDESLVLLSQYNNTKRAIFYITDNYRQHNNGLLTVTLALEAERKYNCKFFVYGIGKGYSKSLETIGQKINPRYDFKHFDDASQLIKTFNKDLSTL
jgi:hypothetical protein